jgi:hypothetical protein
MEWARYWFKCPALHTQKIFQKQATTEKRGKKDEEEKEEGEGDRKGRNPTKLCIAPNISIN